ncbi:MAG: mRNA interferase RelE [Verrucomicrobiota bacterium]|jgi:mRNA interferase RelE/StbE
MPTWIVQFETAAKKQLLCLDPGLQRRIMSKLETLKANPRSQGAIKLSGSSSWRVRVGDYRIIYDILDQQLIVSVIKVGHRREIYR